MNESIAILLRKYLNNLCTADELDQVQDILGSGRYEEEWAVVLQEDAEQMISETNTESLDEERKNQLLCRIGLSAGIGEDSQKPKRNEATYPAWLRIAATVLILLTAGLAFTIVYVLSADNLLQTATAVGEQTEILLPDGSRAWLNDLSTLHYPKEFDGDTRNVFLKGDAFFEVSSNPSQPFLVHSNELTIEVPGTTFSVRAYENDQNAIVTLASGSVIVKPKKNEPDSGLVLMPGDQWIFNRQTGEYRRQKIAAEDIHTIREGRLVFQDQPLEDILRGLERKYDIRFRFSTGWGSYLAEEESSRQLTFKPTGSDLHEMLQVLSLVTGLDMETNNGEVLIKKKNDSIRFRET